MADAMEEDPPSRAPEAGAAQADEEMSTDAREPPGPAIPRDSLWLSGSNSNGQLGNGGAGADSGLFQLVKGGMGWSSVSVGDSHVVASTTEGQLYSWGLSDMGQTGHGDTPAEDVLVPRRIQALDGHATSVACGYEHTAVVVDGEVAVFGSNEFGQLGRGQSVLVCRVPRMVKGLSGVAVASVVCGHRHTLAVTEAFGLFAWGSNCSGQLGLGDCEDRHSPAPVGSLWGIPVAAAAAGEAHTVALSATGRVFTWGRGRRGQLGLPDGLPLGEPALAFEPAAGAEDKRASRRRKRAGHSGPPGRGAGPGLLPDPSKMRALVAMGISEEDAEVALAAVGGGSVERAVEWHFSPISWSAEDSEEPAASPGTRGGRPDNVAWPHRVPGLAGATRVAAGADHTVVVAEGGVFAFGANACGQLGTGGTGDEPLPREVAALRGEQVVGVACGALHTVFHVSSGRVLACGSAESGQLAVEDPRERGVPVEMACAGPASAGHAVFMVAAGGHVSAIVTRPVVAPLFAVTFPSLLAKGDKMLAKLERKLSAVAEQGGVTGEGASRGLCQAVDRVFGSPEAICAAFAETPRGGGGEVGIDAARLEGVYKALLSLYDTQVIGALQGALQRVLDTVAARPTYLTSPEGALVVLAALQSPLSGDRRVGAGLLGKACSLLAGLPQPGRAAAAALLSRYPPAVLGARVLRPIQARITSEVLAAAEATGGAPGRMEGALADSGRDAIEAAALVDEANVDGAVVPLDELSNAAVSEKFEPAQSYLLWRQRQEAGVSGRVPQGSPVTFAEYPFLLNPRGKSRLMAAEASLYKQQTVSMSRQEHFLAHIFDGAVQAGDAGGGTVAPLRRKERRPAPSQSHPPRPPTRDGSMLMDLLARAGAQAQEAQRHAGAGGGGGGGGGGSGGGGAVEAMLMDATAAAPSPIHRTESLDLPAPGACGVPATHPDACIVRVRRAHLVEDALEEVARQKPRDLLKPLRVVFIGEDGVDEGGVRKEFFLLLMAELQSPDFGLFVFHPESRTLYPSPSHQDDDDFLLVGVLIGLGVFNGVILDVPFAQPLYKKMLGMDVGLEDLREMQPGVAQSLDRLLAWAGPGSVEDVFCLTFSVDEAAFGAICTRELKPGGAEVAVTEANRQEYVDLYVAHSLSASVAGAVAALRRGFRMLCGGHVLGLLRPGELETLVTGNQHLDFKALEAAARYEGGYTAESQAVRWLWEVVQKFELGDQRAFLRFVTGSDRAPIGGLGNLQLLVQREGPDSHRLPSSHTCFNTLLLPEYGSRGKLRDRLLTAVHSAIGFGLQ